ncbi:MAG: hypothetical protein PQJ44_07060 [Sphaerochaetaceae bacterium]|nr:hypothetical protein [Sphaerochaetaceae bacterium]
MKWIDNSKEKPKPDFHNPEYSVTVLISDGERISIGYYEYEFSRDDGLYNPKTEKDPTLSYSSGVWKDEISGGIQETISGWADVKFWAYLDFAYEKLFEKK